MKKKIYIELAATLIIGIMIGFFASSLITNKRIQDFSMYKGEWSFWKRALVEINATEEQQKAILPIIKTYSEETRDILHESWKEIPAVWAKMENEIMPLLNKEQQKHIRQLQLDRKKHMNGRIKQDQFKQNGQRPPSGKGNHNGKGMMKGGQTPPPTDR